MVITDQDHQDLITLNQLDEMLIQREIDHVIRVSVIA